MSAEVELDRRRRRRRRILAAGILIFIAYAAWMLGPYLRSVVVRDAAITAWSNTVSSPIQGTIEFMPRNLNGRVGDDSIVAYVRNAHASREAVERARVQRDFARARVEELQSYFDDIVALDAERAELKAHYADMFRTQLDAKIEHLNRRIAITRDLLELIDGIAQRKQQLMDRGVGSQAEADEANLRVRDIEYQLASLEADLVFAKVRREGADRGIFTLDEGDDPDWARDARIELKLERKQARLQLREAEATLSHAEAELKNAEADFERLSTAIIEAPPGSVIWSEHVANGMAVLQGAPVADWVDCDTLLVDVPVSDVEAALIPADSLATVILEGEREPRQGQVILIRGSASTLSNGELAALAKGREAGMAQVVLSLSHRPDEFSACPVGRAAFVDFPGVGLVDILLARLRL